MLILEGLRDAWSREPGLRANVVAWRWFENASKSALQQAAALRAMAITLDDLGLCRAFFEWARSVETHERLERRNPLDFRHAMAGLLLQQLFAVQHGAAQGAAGLMRCDGIDSGTGSPQAAAGTLLTSFVLTLLQALRLHMGAPAFVLDPETPTFWNSYLENAAQDPATAICFLDQMTGLEPVWPSPHLISARPGMQATVIRLPVSR
jgi:hypothetical protein